MKAWKVSLFLIVPVPVLMFATLALETSPILSCDIWDELDPEEEKRRLAKYYKGCMDHYLSNKVQVWLVTLCCFAAVCILASIIDWVPIQDNRLKIGLIVAESLCVGFAICFFLCPYLVLAFKVERFRCDYDPEYRISNSESELLFSYSEESLLSQELNSSLSSLG
ncbi:hypothetical protein [Neorickettsia helminthoeca]|nr:hypothetical protein [Neorickettsia helminthoeca]